MENEQRHYELRSGSRSRSRTPLIQTNTLIEPETLEHHYELRSQSREKSYTSGEIANNKKSGFKISYVIYIYNIKNINYYNERIYKFKYILYVVQIIILILQ